MSAPIQIRIVSSAEIIAAFAVPGEEFIKLVENRARATGLSPEKEQGELLRWVCDEIIAYFRTVNLTIHLACISGRWKKIDTAFAVTTSDISATKVGEFSIVFHWVNRRSKYPSLYKLPGGLNRTNWISLYPMKLTPEIPEPPPLEDLAFFGLGIGGLNSVSIHLTDAGWKHFRKWVIEVERDFAEKSDSHPDEVKEELQTIRGTLRHAKRTNNRRRWHGMVEIWMKEWAGTLGAGERVIYIEAQVGE